MKLYLGIFLCIATIFYCATSLIGAQTIAEKKASFAGNRETDELHIQLEAINTLLFDKRSALQQLYQTAYTLYHRQDASKELEAVWEEIRQIKDEVVEIETLWREEASLSANESYALWHQPDTTILQLVIDYGAQEFIYLVPPEIGMIRLSLSSNLPIPRQSWKENLELILNNQGIGIKELTPFLRELFFLRRDFSNTRYMIGNRQELEILPSQARVCFALEPETTDIKSILTFLQKFSNSAITDIHPIGGVLFIHSTTESVKELLKLYDFVKKGHRGYDYQLISLGKLEAKDVEAILHSAFQYGGADSEDSACIKVLPLSSLSGSLFLFGSKEEVQKAVKLIKEIESQIEDPVEKTVFWYTAKHSDAEDLATVLTKVYDLLKGQSAKFETSTAQKISKVAEEAKSALIVKPPAIEPLSSARKSHKTSDGQNNFIVDQKTGSIIMVVEQSALPKIKDLLKRLDVPKKMVRIEVLLFEKKIANNSKSGLNLLKLGSGTSDSNEIGGSWQKVGSGILEFLISRSKTGAIPAFDLAYHFLLGQEDVQINATPSVTTVNQTPATIAVVEEISVNTGSLTEKDKIKTDYSRAHYGTTIQITPTINSGSETEDGQEYVTLETDITFDTMKKSQTDRPDVTRRHIKNLVRIADGQTVIIGGLRRKNSQDSVESIPFLGEIPGIGKLFSTNDSNDSNTEMFVFITPKIIHDPIEENEKRKKEELCRRPGDCPEFICELIEARQKEKNRLFQKSFNLLFGSKSSSSSVHSYTKEYEGK